MVDEYAPNAKGYRKGGKFFFEGVEDTVICELRKMEQKNFIMRMVL